MTELLARPRAGMAFHGLCAQAEALSPGVHTPHGTRALAHDGIRDLCACIDSSIPPSRHLHRSERVACGQGEQGQGQRDGFHGVLRKATAESTRDQHQQPADRQVRGRAFGRAHSLRSGDDLAAMRRSWAATLAPSTLRRRAGVMNLDKSTNLAAIFTHKGSLWRYNPS